MSVSIKTFKVYALKQKKQFLTIDTPKAYALKQKKQFLAIDTPKTYAVKRNKDFISTEQIKIFAVKTFPGSVQITDDFSIVRQVEQPSLLWQQPVLNNNGVMGADAFAVSSNFTNNPYYATQDYQNYLNGFNEGKYIDFYIKDSIVIHQIDLTSSDGYLPSSGSIYGSNDNSQWVKIGSWGESTDHKSVTGKVFTNSAYHYIRVEANSKCSAHPNNNADVSTIRIKAYKVNEVANVHIDTLCDSARSLQRDVSAIYNTYRSVGQYYSIKINQDAYRIIEKSIDAPFDTRCNLSNACYSVFDSDRKLAKEVSFSVNVIRDTRGTAVIDTYDLHVDIAKSINQKYKTKNLVTNTVTRIFDIERALQINRKYTVIGDAERKISQYIETDNDTFISNYKNNTSSYDAYRRLKRDFIIENDTVLRYPYIMDGKSVPIRNIKVSLQEGALSDTVTIEAQTDLYPKDAVKGKFLDYRYNMLVESTEQTDSFQTIKAMYYMDDLLHTSRKYSFVSEVQKQIDQTADSEKITSEQVNKYVKNSKGSAINIARKIAGCVNLAPIVSFEDFIPDNSYSDTKVKYNDLLNSLFSWTNYLPWRQINVFIRDGGIHFVQRGFESRTIDITDFKYKRPQITRTIYKSEFVDDDKDKTNEDSSHTQLDIKNHDGTGLDDGGDKSNTEDDDPASTYDDYDSYTPYLQPVYFNGTVTCGNTKLYYEDGLMVRKIVTVDEAGHGDVKFEGEYSYDKERRLVGKSEWSDDGTKVITDVKFDGSSDNGSYTMTEKTYMADSASATTSKDDIVKIVVTVSQNLGNGFVGVSTYVDGEYQGTSISGSGTLAPTEYTTNQASLNNGSNEWKHKDGDDPKNYIGGKGKDGKDDDSQTGKDTKTDDDKDIPANAYGIIPTRDKDFAKKLIKECHDHHNGLQETVTLTLVFPVINGVPAYKHVIDFRDRIIFRGKTYHLESNDVEMTPVEYTQTISIVRWGR